MVSMVISYSREDFEFASRLAADLRAAGRGVALAALDGAASGEKTVEAALARCSAWLVVLSPSSVRSTNVGLDVAVAAGRAIPMIGLLWRDCAIPARLQNLKLIDFRTDYSSGLRQLSADAGTEQARPVTNNAALYVPARNATLNRRARPVPAAPGADRGSRDSVVRTAAAAAKSVKDADDGLRTSRSGRLLRSFGIVLLVAAVFGFFAVQALVQAAIDDAEIWLGVAVAFVIEFVVAFTGVKLLKRGKQVAALSAAAVLAEDKRSPVVYLRSFEDDSVAAQGSLSTLPLGGGLLLGIMLAGLDMAGGVASEEEQLAEVLRPVGPFVAVGKPGEKLPQLGASRMYVEDADWKEVVRSLMARAGLVVLRAGGTEGLWWEVQTAAEMVRPERILLILPFEREQYEAFRARAAASFGHRLPEYPAGRRVGSAGSVRGIVYFERDWTPHFRQPAGVYRAPKAAFKGMLEPVFEQLGVRVEKPKRPVLKLLMLIVVVSVAAILMAIVALALIGLGVRIFD